MTGKVKAWLMEMEDYAIGISKKKFLKKYPSHGDVWEYMNDPRQEDDSYVLVRTVSKI